MCTQIKETEIKNLDFKPATHNRSRIWHNKLEKIITEGDNNKNINISFVTTSGSYRVNTSVVDVLENYAKIKEEVVIPLNSISKIYPESLPVIAIEEDSWSFKLAIFSIVLFILISFLILLIFNRFS